MQPSIRRRAGKQLSPAHLIDPLERRVLLSLSLVYDHNTATADSFPSNFIELNGTILFTAANSAVGTELFKSDGTPAGTSLLKDIFAGPTGSSIVSVTRFGNIVLFYANTTATGLELWKSDGTTQGTSIVKDIYPGFQTSANLNTPDGRPAAPALIPFMGKIFFAAADGSHGLELWSTDGTAGGTSLLKDILPGSGASVPANFLVAGDTLYFTATDTTRGLELWKSDGTPAGTVPVTNLTDVVKIGKLTAFAGSIFFSVTTASGVGNLYRTDSSAGGASVLKTFSIPIPSDLVVSNNILFFSAFTQSGQELWKSDGTVNGTVIVKDINLGNFSSSPAALTDLNGTLLFTASDVTSGNEPWRSDGTAQGTTRLLDAAPGTAGSSTASFTIYNGRAYFVPFSSAGFELFATDGTPQNTAMVADIAPASASSQPAALSVLAGKLFFSASAPGVGREPFFIDGINPPTLLADVNTETLSSDPSALIPFAGRYFYTATDPDHGREIWTSDGTSQGTSLFLDLNPGPADSIWLQKNSENPEADDIFATVVGDALYFVAQDSVGFGLWRTDGSVGGTKIVYRFPQGISWVPIAPVGNRIILPGWSAQEGDELWVFDTGSAQTSLVKDIWPGFRGSDPNHFLVSGNTMFFEADDSVHGREIWKTDGTEAGTVLVKDINPGGLPGYFMASRSFSPITYKGEVYFSAESSGFGRELWKSDGTEAGTVRLTDVPNDGSEQPDNFQVLNDILYFRMHYQLWRTDGTPPGTFPVSQLTGINYLVSNGSRLFFVKSSALWTSDGTAAGTVQVYDSDVTRTVAASDGNITFFHANGDTLWTTSGNDTHAVGGPLSLLHPRNERWLDGALYFTGVSTSLGNELWRFVPPSVLGARLSGRTVSFQFSDDVGWSSETRGPLTIYPRLRNLGTGQSSSLPAMQVDQATHRASVALPDNLPEAHYSITLEQFQVTDSYNNSITAEFNFTFFKASPGAGDDSYRLSITDAGRFLIFKDSSSTPQYDLPLAGLSAILFGSSAGLDSILLDSPLPQSLTLELANATLQVQTTASQRSATASVLGWRIGNGLITSTALASNSNLTLAISTSDTLITIKPALIGDLNLDGQVSIADFITLSSHFNQSGLWEDGDINYDEQITIADFIDLSSHFGQIWAAPQAPASAQITSTTTDSPTTVRAPQRRALKHLHRARPGTLRLAPNRH